MGSHRPYSRVATLQQWRRRSRLVKTIVKCRKTLARPSQLQRGLSLLEVVISMALLTIGLVSLAGVFGLAMASTQESQAGMLAKPKANDVGERRVTARNTAHSS